jgi:signal transduction histidine kinase
LDGAARSEEICFDDDGPGISPDDRQRIIRRGERATGEGEGSGLGLAIVIEALARYGVALSIGQSPLGGCRMSFPALGLVQAPQPFHGANKSRNSFASSTRT